MILHYKKRPIVKYILNNARCHLFSVIVYACFGRLFLIITSWLIPLEEENSATGHFNYFFLVQI